MVICCSCLRCSGRWLKSRHPLSCYRRHGANGLNALNEIDRVAALHAHYQPYREALTEHLANAGKTFDPSTWQSREGYLEHVMHIGQAIERAIAPGEGFLLIDEDRLNLGTDFRGRRRWHMLDFSGQYGGIPSSDEAAIAAIEQAIREGARYCVMTRDSFWWLDHFHEFARWLADRCREAVRDEHVIIWRCGG